MKVDDLYDITVGELLDEFCVVYSPECGYYYGITRWDDAKLMWDEYKLKDEYCFVPDSLIPLDYGFDGGEPILEEKDLRRILNYLGIEKKDSDDDG